MAAARSPPWSDPAKVQLWRSTAMPRSARSAALFDSTGGRRQGQEAAERAPSYAGFWVTRRSGGVVCRHFDDLDAVLESDTSDDLRQLICAFQPPPVL